MKTVLWAATLVFFLLSWWWYVCPHKQVCPFGSNTHNRAAPTEIEKTTPDIVPPETKETLSSSAPIAFKWSQAVPITSTYFNSYRDSVLAQLGDTDQIEVMGKYHPTEDNQTAYENLGLARAHQIKDLLTGIDSNRLILKSQLLHDTISHDEAFVAYSLRKMVYNESLREIEGRMVINFPHASNEMLDNTQLNKYLEEVVTALQKTKEKVFLVGHTDSSAGQARNQRLGQMRADAIKQLLVNKGLSPQRIIASSKGESEPIADNGTAKGRRQNRRVELTIIQ